MKEANMDYKELIERLATDREWAEANEWESPICLQDDLSAAIAAVEKLKAYEDTGLEPEEIKKHEAAYNECLTRTYGPFKQKISQWLRAEKGGQLVAQKTTPGKQVWIIERDECGEPYEISGYMFLASTGNAVIVTAYIDDMEGLEETLGYHIQETAENYDTDLAVFPVEDCYLTYEEAETALEGGKDK